MDAKGDLVMCLDSDSAIEKNALLATAKHFEDEKLVALAANVKIIDDGSLLSLIQIFEYIICYQMKRAQTIFNVEYIVGGIGSTFRRSMLKRVNFYDTNTITEDIDLTLKIISEGNKKNRVAYGADVVVHTGGVQSISGLIKQRFRWKYGRAQTFWKNRSLFFNTDRKYSRWLTCGYLPFAIFCDFTFLLEPIAAGFIFYVAFRFADPLIVVSALTVISLYIGLNVLAENTIPVKKKLALLPLVPTMYLFFYVLSFVEYMALIKSIPKMHKVPESIRSNVCHWDHVARARKPV
jgi:cellulose synthase/poly-beta-1,6-N-acetylglucosamine synthase-like glycosyltransferase